MANIYAGDETERCNPKEKKCHLKPPHCGYYVEDGFCTFWGPVPYDLAARKALEGGHEGESKRAVRSEKDAAEEVDELYKLLSSEYTLFSGRTDTLTGRAQSLLVFGGIVNAILVVIVMGVTSAATGAFLTQYANLPFLRIIVICGFIFYVFSVVLSLLAYRTKKYFPVPQLGREFVKAVISGKAKVNKQAFLLPMVDAIEFYQGQNNKKYRWLHLATLMMLVAILFTAFLGIILFLAIG